MLPTLLMVAGMASPALDLPAGARFFPGSYFDSTARAEMHGAALAWWPAPSRLLEIWQAGGLDPEAQVVFLLSAAAFRDPDLLPAYLDGIQSPHERVRKAAAYGYRSLIGDALPDVRGEVDPATAAALEDEIRAVAATLRATTPVAMWLHAGLATEGSGLPGWTGVVMRRPAAACWLAVDRLLQPEDLDLLVTAYWLSRDAGNRGALLLLIEGLALERFVQRARGPREGRGERDEMLKFERLERWIAQATRPPGCRVDPSRVLQRRFAEVGAGRLDPFAVEACVLWQELLAAGEPSWRASVGRRLYDCGGPGMATELSTLWAESPQMRKLRDELLSWYRLLKPGRSGTGPAGAAGRPPGVQ